MVACWAGDALAESVGALQVAAESPYFRKGMEALAEGDLAGADYAFIEGGSGANSFTGDLIAKGYHKAAANFAKHYHEAVERAQERAAAAMNMP
jgi:hypothetical protein